MTKDKSKVAGAVARANALTPEQRKEIAAHAAAKRWGKIPKASHKGNFQKEFGIDVDCYVLDDARKTAVISQSGMAKALGLSPRGNAFPRFLSSKAMVAAVGAQLAKKIEKPFKFQWGVGGADQPSSIINGFDVKVLTDICKLISLADAKSELAPNQKAVAKQANIILSASANLGISHLVYALAGYNPTVEEVIASFKLYVREEARKYESEFPNEIYQQWYRLYDIPLRERGKPWTFRHLTVKHIYYPLARINGKILALLRALKANGGDQKKKLFQFLNEVGAKALRIHLGRVLEMAESSVDALTYEKKIADRFGDQPELDLVMPPPTSASASPLLSSQSPNDAPETLH